MRAARLTLFLAAALLFAGCIGNEPAQWGNDGIKVDFALDGTSITSNLGDSQVNYEGILPVGCNTDNITAETNQETAIKFSGYMSASTVYDSHNPINGAKSIELAVTAAVAIQSMSFKEATSVVEGESARIDLKEWNRPLSPQSRSGSVDIDEVNEETDSEWYVLGLIPTTENVNQGFRSLNEWHKPITIHGHLISGTNSEGSAVVPSTNGFSAGFFNDHEVTDDCELVIGDQNIESLFVLVEQITFEDSVVSKDGDQGSDEWKYGDVPFFGRTGFIVFFLIVGIGGAFGAFVLSQMFVRHGAKATMQTLLGSEGLAKIKQVAADLKRDKKSGTMSPKERAKQLDREYEQDNKLDKPAKRKKPEKADSAISGFDLESALSTGSSDDGPKEFGGGSSSVVVSEESKKIDASLGESYSAPAVAQDPPWKRSQSNSGPSSVSNVVASPQAKPERKQHFSSVAKPSSAKSSKTAAPVKKRATKKRKAVKRTAKEDTDSYHPQAEPPPAESFDDEDFSDFSL